MITKLLFSERALLAILILLGLYYLVGVFPITPVFGDGIDIANGATHMARTEIGPTPLGYRYSQHPGTHVLLAIVSRIFGVDAHTAFLVFCAVSAIAFVILSALLVSGLTGCSIGLAGISVLLFQEASAAAYYANSNVLAGAIGMAGLYLLYRNPASAISSLWAGVLIGSAVFVRLDAVLLAVAAMPILFQGNWLTMLLRTARVAVVSILFCGALYVASGASLTDVLDAVSFKEDLFSADEDWGNTVRSHVAYFSALTVVMIVAGIVQFVQKKQWHILAIWAAGVLPFYILFPDGVDTPRYLYYATPFWALLVAQSLWSVVSMRAGKLQYAVLIFLALLFAGQYFVGLRTFSDQTAPSNRPTASIRIADGVYVAARIGPGEHAVAPSINGGRLASGLIFAPMWHRSNKEIKRQRALGLHDLLRSKSGQSYAIRVIGWTEATLVRWSLLKQGYEFAGVTDDPSRGTSQYVFSRQGHTVRETHYRVAAVSRIMAGDAEFLARQVSEPGDLWVMRNRRLAELVLSGVEGRWQQKTRLAYEMTTEQRDRSPSAKEQ